MEDARPRAHALERLRRHVVVLARGGGGPDVRLEVVAARVDEPHGRVELRAHEARVLPHLGEERLAAPARRERRAALVAVPVLARVRAADAEGRDARVAVEEGRLGLVVVEEEGWEGEAAEEREGDGPDPG